MKPYFLSLLLAGGAASHCLASETDLPLIIGHYEQWSIYSPNVHIRDLPLNRLDFLIYESSDLTEAAEVASYDTVADLDRTPVDNESGVLHMHFGGNFAALIKAKEKNPRLRTLIAIGGWGKSRFFSRIAANEELREKGASSAVEFMQHYGFDGIDIDWQFPIEDKSAPDSHRPEDPDNFVKFIQAIRRHMDNLAIDHQRRYFLSITMDQEHIPNAVAIAQAARSLDFINLHTSYIYGFWDKTTHNISPLHTPGDNSEIISTDTYVSALQRVGVPSRKIVIDVTPFASGWQDINLTPQQSPLYAEAGEISWGTWDVQPYSHFGIYSRTFLNNLMRTNEEDQKYQEYWDDASKASYLFSPAEHNGHFISFESERSIAEKLAYINDHKLGGIGIRQLHADSHDSSSLVVEIYDSIYPLRGLWLDIGGIFFANRHRIVSIGGNIIGGLIIFFVFVLIYKIRTEHARIRDANRYHWLGSQLQLLEWPLTRLYESRALTAEKAGTLKTGKLLYLNDIVARLLRPVANLLAETRMWRSERPAILQPITGAEVQAQLCMFLSEKLPAETVRENISIDDTAVFYSDPIYLIKTIGNLYFWALGVIEDTSIVSIRSAQLNDDIFDIRLNCDSEKTRTPNKQDYFNLKEIYKIAQNANIEIQPADQKAVGFHIYIPAAKNFIADSFSNWIQNRQLPGNQPSAATTTPVVHAGSTPFELEAFEFLEKADAHAHDITRLIDHACEFFVVKQTEPVRLAVYQGDTLLTELGDPIDDDTGKQDIQLGEFKFVIESTQPLAQQDIQYLSFVVSQIRLVQRALKELVNEPSLFAELNEIVANRDRLNYLKSDGGYSALYFAEDSSPRYISLRLRTIKQYFDDDALLQIHRSYLINPKKVIRAVKIGKLKYAIEIAGNTLPVSRTYVDGLRERYPRWFQS